MKTMHYGEFVEIKESNNITDDWREKVLGGEIWYN